MTGPARDEIGALHDLARDCGVVVEWRDADGREHEVSPDALVAVLRSLGSPLDGPTGAGAALADRRADRARRLVDPTIVVWDHGPVATTVTHGLGEAEQLADCRVLREDGVSIEWGVRLGGLPVADAGDSRHSGRIRRVLDLPAALPIGSHRLDIAVGHRHDTATILVAPVRGAASGPPALEGRWGIVAPLYTLRDGRGGAPGDLGHLACLAEIGGKYGASVVATLPLLAAFLDDPLEPSPYAPVSRRFWNELYTDLSRIPEVAGSPAAARMAEPSWQAEMRALRDAPSVDYARAATRHRDILELLAAAIDRAPVARTDAFRRFAEEHPEVSRYARFRAAGERLGPDWRRWPPRLRDGDIDVADVDPAAERYHRYVQWIAHEQLTDVRDRLERDDQILALDLPLGSHPLGYDVWSTPTAYAQGAQAGAPPDPFAPTGQGWGFPPVHPDATRHDGHAAFRACLAHHFQFSRLLRIDHVMGLHRLWWIPDGGTPADGAYVRYPAEELWAVVCLEASRAGAAVVGENLGTVPVEVEEALHRHGARGMSVAQFRADPLDVADAGAGDIAMWGTHDMATFAGWHSEHDGEPGGEADGEPGLDLRGRFDRFLTVLADSAAGMVMVGLDDIVLDPSPQNVPGTVDDRNWRVPCPVQIEDLDDDPGRAGSLRILADHRGRPMPRDATGAATDAPG